MPFGNHVGSIVERIAGFFPINGFTADQVTVSAAQGAMMDRGTTPSRTEESASCDATCQDHFKAFVEIGASACGALAGAGGAIVMGAACTAGTPAAIAGCAVGGGVVGTAIGHTLGQAGFGILGALLYNSSFSEEDLSYAKAFGAGIIGGVATLAGIMVGRWAAAKAISAGTRTGAAGAASCGIIESDDLITLPMLFDSVGSYDPTATPDL